MPTMNPRITITVSEELMQRIDEYRFTNRMRNQTQAIVSLINIGFEGVQEAGGSNPLTQTTKSPENTEFSGLLLYLENLEKWRKMAVY